MAVKVLTRRNVPRNKAKEIIPLFRQLRVLAINQKGVISIETLRNLEKPEEFLVISTWHSSNAFQNWLEIKKRKEIQDKMDSLLSGKIDYQIFYHGFTQ